MFVGHFADDFSAFHGLLLFDGFREVAEEKKIADENEPPAKRARKNVLDVDSSRIDESLVNEELSKLSAPLETSNILCTPHVQKRLNKLLLNTPESSPLTSILKVRNCLVLSDCINASWC